MVQMIGVLMVAIGLPRMFASIEHGQHVDNSVMVLGYVIMRVALLFQWLRAARVVAAAVIAAVSGLDMAVCLVILMLAPAVTVIGYEQRGYGHQAQSLRIELD